MSIGTSSQRPAAVSQPAECAFARSPWSIAHLSGRKPGHPENRQVGASVAARSKKIERDDVIRYMHVMSRFVRLRLLMTLTFQ
jgi:hypothetical protein